MGKGAAKFGRRTGLETPWDEYIQKLAFLGMMVVATAGVGICYGTLYEDHILGPVVLGLISVFTCSYLVTWVLVSMIDPAHPESLPMDEKRRPRPLFRATPLAPRVDCLRGSAVHCAVCRLGPLPPTVKHCRRCNKCVEDFDHHCRWLNHCIGRRNYPAFLAYIVTTMGASSFVATLSISLLIHRLSLDDATKFPGYTYLFGQDLCVVRGLEWIWVGFAAFAAIVSLLFAFFLASLLWLNISLMIQGLTMWESSVVDEIEEMMAEAYAEDSPQRQPTLIHRLKGFLREGCL